MVGKGAKQLDTPRWRYPVVETALARVLDIRRAEQEGWFRARIINFRRLGLAPPSGRGKVVLYSFEWCALWFLALVLNVRHRIDPKVIASFISENRATLFDLIGRARHARSHQEHMIMALHITAEGMASVDTCTIEGLPRLGYGLSGKDPERAGLSVTILDLTNDLLALASVLVGQEHDASDDSEPKD